MSNSTKTQPVKNVSAAKSNNKTETEIVHNGNQVFLFDRDNYKWMIAGAVILIIGYFLLSGGKSPDPHQFHYDVVYSFRRVTLAPVVLVLGFAIEVYAIMKKPKQHTA